LRRQRTEEKDRRPREVRGPYRRQRAIEGIRAEEETGGGREDRGLLRKERVIERIEGRREDRGPWRGTEG
jgi:hypothetical protein